MPITLQRFRKLLSFVLLSWKNLWSREDKKYNALLNLFIIFSFGLSTTYLTFQFGTQFNDVSYTEELILFKFGLVPLSIFTWIFLVPAVVYWFDKGGSQKLKEIWYQQPETAPTVILVVEGDEAAVAIPINWKPTQEQETIILRSRAVIDGILGINNDYVVTLFLFWLSDPIVRRGLHDHYDRQGYLVTFTEATPGNYWFISLNKLRSLEKPFPKEESKNTQKETTEARAKTLAATAKSKS